MLMGKPAIVIAVQDYKFNVNKNLYPVLVQSIHHHEHDVQFFQ